VQRYWLLLTKDSALLRAVLRRHIIFCGIFFSTLFFSCSQIRLTTPQVHSPIIRVGVVLNADEIAFQPSAKMYISTKKAGERYKSQQTDVWKVRVDRSSLKPAKIRLKIGNFAEKAEARKEATRLTESGVKTRIEQVGDELWYEGRIISGSKKWRLYVAKEFDDEDKAAAYKRENRALAKAKLISDKLLSGDILLISPKGDQLAVRDAVRLSGPEFTIHNVQVGEGYHWSRKETRAYNGELEFRIDKNGKLMAINVVPLEDYIKGVVPGEMSATFPLEALKAQAIAARTFFLYNFGRTHIDDPFDACADVHCQVFVGSKNKNEKVEKAVRETRGVAVLNEGELCTTPFSAVCGGHTEHSENVWIGGPQSHLRGVFDILGAESIGSKFDLSLEENARTWIESLPTVFCNVQKNGDPEYAAYAKKFFRWQVVSSRKELEKNIESYTGKKIGSLVDIESVSRGVSGRLVELRIVGTKDSFTIGKELRIRKALSSETLYSACFVVQKKGGSNGLADEFVIKGAGWGHGVGMCQIGAALMAEKGGDARTILEHYFSGTNVKRLY
jgi:stage II sporulation protein D